MGFGKAVEGDAVVWAESGVPFASLARQLARDGYGGIEWAAGIPGTMGGAVVYNAGAYDGCLADVLLAVTILDGANQQRSVPAAEMKLAYRSSAILRGECSAASCCRGDRCAPRREHGSMRRIADWTGSVCARSPRAQLRQHIQESTGRPRMAADRCRRAARPCIGDARISRSTELHRQPGNARAADVAALMREAERRVKEQFGMSCSARLSLWGGLRMTSKLRLGVVFGGQSVEHEVSVASAIEMLQAADRRDSRRCRSESRVRGAG
jgi:UDP-N-acetylmuramate dehydrogenase